MQETIAAAARLLQRARHPIFLSGAGISAESGIPVFRGNDGLWKNYRPEELATPEAFARDPHLVWQWYNWRRRLIAECKPNAAHYATVRLKQLLPGLLCVTQNVDGFHALAGLTEILEMHGNIYRTRCLSCKKVEENRNEIDPTTPCPACGKVPLRPDVVWFGEALPRAVMDRLHERLQFADVILVVGTSGTVYPAAGFAIEVRRRLGNVIEINTDEGHRPYAEDIYLRGKAGDLLPAIVQELERLP
ncbi:MAG: NAD-dependent deacylase [Spirochaetota bacterium]